jgi:FtsH-binding integral membrane protein
LGWGPRMNLVDSVSKWIHEYVPKWMQTAVQGLFVYLLFWAMINWILAPLLDFVPAVALFGLLFVLITVLVWRGITGPVPQPQKALVVAFISIVATLTLYAATLRVKNDTTYEVWLYPCAAGVAFGGLFVLARFALKDSRLPH